MAKSNTAEKVSDRLVGILSKMDSMAIQACEVAKRAACENKSDLAGLKQSLSAVRGSIKTAEFVAKRVTTKEANTKFVGTFAELSKEAGNG